MTKYIGPSSEIANLIKDIFAVSSITLDSKLILLVLAATVPKSTFAKWIDTIEELNAFNANFKKINTYRHNIGDNARNLLLVIAFVNAKHDVSTKELQGFISKTKRKVGHNCISIPDIDIDSIEYLQDKNFIQALSIAENSFRGNYKIFDLDLTMMLSVYNKCRTVASPATAAKALQKAINNALMQNNIASDSASATSKKLVQYTLRNIYLDKPKYFLPKFSSK